MLRTRDTLALVAAVVATSCQFVIGLDPVELAPESASSGGAGGAAGGAAGHGGGGEAAGGADGGGGTEPSCKDGKRNNQETDIDCGGGTCVPCEDQQGCTVGSDCLSKACSNGTCVAAKCLDGIKNASETDTDCGGLCSPCPAGKHCDVPADCESEVCTGHVCADTYVWQSGYGNSFSSSSVGNAVDTDARGNIAVAGVFSGAIDFGGGPLNSQGNGDIFVAKLTADGGYRWAKPFGALNQLYGVALAGSKSGTVTLAGSFQGQLTFGGATFTNLSGFGGSDLYTVTFDEDGNHVWSQAFHSSMSWASIRGVTTDAASNVVLTGDFQGSLPLGNPAITSAGSDDSAYIAKFDAAGVHQWSNSFGYAGSSQRGKGVAIDSAGNIIGLGAFTGLIIFGGDITTAMNAQGPGRDAYLVKLDPLGNYLWSKQFSGFSAANTSFYNLAVDADDNIIISGGLDGGVNFGGTKLVNVAGAADMFVAKFDPSGQHVWSRRFGDSQQQAGWTTSTDADGNLFVTGTFSGKIDFGGGSLESAGNGDICIAKFDPIGQHLWSRRYGTTEEDNIAGVAVADGGHVIIAGNTTGAIDFGGGPIPSTGNKKFVLAKLLSP